MAKFQPNNNQSFNWLSSEPFAHADLELEWSFTFYILQTEMEFYTGYPLNWTKVLHKLTFEPRRYFYMGYSSTKMRFYTG